MVNANPPPSYGLPIRLYRNFKNLDRDWRKHTSMDGFLDSWLESIVGFCFLFFNFLDVAYFVGLIA